MEEKTKKNRTESPQSEHSRRTEYQNRMDCGVGNLRGYGELDRTFARAYKKMRVRVIQTNLEGSSALGICYF